MTAQQIWVDIKSLLGKGQFSKVFRGKLNYSKDNELKVAVKRVLVEDLQQNARYHHLAQRDACQQSNQREEEALQNLDHPNIIKLLCVESRDPFRYFALELCSASLYQFCTGKYDGPMPSDAAVLLDIVNGLVYIHSRGLAHRNIEPKNILISSTTIPVSIVLADFGLSKPVSSNGSFSVSRDHPVQGTLCWKAPEMLDHPDDEAFSEKRGSVASDTFSAGCVFFFFLTLGWHPFGRITSPFIMENIFVGKPVYLKHLPDHHGHFKELIESMIANNPQMRVQLEEVQMKLKKMNEVYDQPIYILPIEDDQVFDERPDWLI